MEIVYRAVDGTIFKSKEDCLDYENVESFKFWDYRGRPILEYSEAYVIYIPNELALCKLNAQFSQTCYLIDEIGWWYWDNDLEGFLWFDDLKRQYEFILDIQRKEGLIE